MNHSTNNSQECAWKPNWEETKQHFVDWWDHKGLVLGMWGAPLADHPRPGVPQPESAGSVAHSYTNAEWRSRANHFELSQRAFPCDTLPLANICLGPGSLALYLGSEPEFAPDTVWFSPTIQEIEQPETLPSFQFDAENRWWQITESLAQKCRVLAGNDYLVGIPDLVESMDILATLREPQTLLMDMIERPEWIREKLREINQVWFKAYNRIYEIVKLPDGSSAFSSFYIWGPGKTAKMQCDTSAMFSPEMFGEIVIPSLTEQAEWLDHSMYHLDGTQALCHLDHLLEIEALDAIEWTPQAGIETGGSPRWWDLYRCILEAGKSVQIVQVKPEEIVPLLDAIGGKGVYIMAKISSEKEAEELLAKIEQFR